MTDFDVMRKVAVPLAMLLMLAGCSASREVDPIPAPTLTSTALPMSPATPPAAAPTTVPTGPITGPTGAPSPGGRVPSPRPIAPKPSGANTPKVVNVTGTVREGTEPGCLLLDDYLLVNAPTSLVYAGVRVKLTLEIRSDLVTTCMQGTAATITSAQRL